MDYDADEDYFYFSLCFVRFALSLQLLIEQ